MGYNGPQYCDVGLFRYHNGQTDAKAALDTYFRALLKAASRILDRDTGRWFDERAATIKTQGSGTSPLLFLPAQIIELTSVTEGGTLLTEGTDFYRHDSWLEKLDFTSWPTERQRLLGAYWSPVPDDVVIVGKFGMAQTPEDIKLLTASIAGAVGEYRKRTFVAEDGTVAEVPTSSLPKIIRDEITRLTFRRGGNPVRAKVTYS